VLLGGTGELAARARLERGLAQGGAGCRWLGSGAVLASVQPWGVPGLDALERVASDPTGSWLALSGHPWLEKLDAAPAATPGAGLASALLARLAARGLDALRELDGGFALAWFDTRGQRLWLIRDRFGSEPLFYAQRGRALLFASQLRALRASGALPGGLDGQGLAEYLSYCFVPGEATLDRGARRVPAGHALELDLARGELARRRWYRLSFAAPHAADERELAAGFAQRLERAVQRRLEPRPTGIFLSGGMDSSAVAALARRHASAALHSYAFRCAGGSFDESVYARALAEQLGTRHGEVEYGPDQALDEGRFASRMDVPFSDSGINVGTWLLGEAARTEVSCVLTGDGGDELWASHPVYAAQRLVRPYDALPRPLQRLLCAAAHALRDSERKRDLRVALKRILPSPELPRALAHFRWRCYYTSTELQALLTPEGAALIRDADPYAPVLAAYEGYDGPADGLSLHLYNDYSTASSYYFSRLGLLRALGIEARSPFYDRELVEYGARIPARLKLEGIERTKRLFREAMRETLPELITGRRDKLGHSVPLKNWLREPGNLANWLTALLSERRLRARGLFKPAAVARLLEEHRRRRHNHSHRLWALAVLECWLEANADEPAPER
jgi:asparagine synthase (glutamine-hydrolysing)